MIYRQAQIYKFLGLCEQENFEKKILDCGAGGDRPPLGLFFENGYETCGIEFDDEQINKASEFEKSNKMKLNIIKGDMRKLPFEDCSFPFVYSYNSVFHMKKSDVAVSIGEMLRVLKSGGLMLVNFLTKEDEWFGRGEDLGDGQFIQFEHGHDVIHSYFDIEEAEQLLKGTELIHREKRLIDRIYEGGMLKQGYVDYIVRKK